ncbi:hypothetical protein FA15DRAFT_682056 [Coprinopsis marcescibilis]|uniref:Splicing arginine serine-rich 12 n=1 Tax=Coprinopsis marcescibilis TaxID=230819 RepID=A0A5C3KNT1_COPMA|nr:hypothetical protein FA15DRAFT_682056 [Coprinopsis marcescibilis]
MPSRRSASPHREHGSHRSRGKSSERTRNRSRDRRRSRSRTRSRSPERAVELPFNAQPISEKDYFQKSDEFRLWLREEKDRYFDELSGDKARSYFRKFVKAWNRGKLSKKHYRGIEPGSVTATTNTSYKWSFAANSNASEGNALRAAREEVGAATYGRSARYYNDDDDDEVDIPARPSGSRSSRPLGPTLPTAADLTLARELNAEQADELRAYKRKREKKEAKDRVEDMVGPKPVGREAMLEKKQAKRENDRAFREGGDEGLEVDEDTLMGGGDSFKAQLARRDAAKRRWQDKRTPDDTVAQERGVQRREKEKATMDMFQQLAKQRFG